MSKKKKSVGEVQDAMSVPMETSVCIGSENAVLTFPLPYEKNDEPMVFEECSVTIGDVVVEADAVDVTNPGVVQGASVDVVEMVGDEVVMGVVEEEGGVQSEPVEPQKRSRRSNGSGSIWQASTGKWGICISLGKTDSGRKLRYVKYFKTLGEAEAGLKASMDNINKLRAIRLENIVQSAEIV